ncbi:MAG: CRISPR system precrRNA processing endoribonuclease RAMP protein Cas6 [Promethearchaeota archaeon]
MIVLTFELYPENGHIRPYEVPFGYVFRGVLMKWLSDSKPELVHELHDHEKIRPYSINFFIHRKIPKIDFKLITYQSSISDALLKDLILNNKSKLFIGEKCYILSQIGFERIDLTQLMHSTHPIKSFSIHFVTPVYFNTRLGDYPVRFPLPSLLFGNLASIWNAINPKVAEINREEFINWVNAHVYISYYKMKTVQRNIGKPEKVSGGLGSASFNVQKANKNYYKNLLKNQEQPSEAFSIQDHYMDKCRWLDALCKLGQYTNVGANRTAGLGIIKYYPKKYFNKES